jgi:hypothetical protein
VLGTKPFYILSDKTFIKIRYFLKFKKKLNLDDPSSFNEKLQYLKLYNRNCSLVNMVDKYQVKDIVSDLIGHQYIIPSYGVWNRFEDIDFAALPKQFVLKTTHDSGGVVICKDKSFFDYDLARKTLVRHQKMKYFYKAREWPYKYVEPRILAEKYVENKTQDSLVVYKVFCMSGKPYIIQVIQGDKTSEETIDYFDTDWHLLDLKQNYDNSSIHLPRPTQLEKMLELSRILSKDQPFIRVDWYEVAGKLLFSEFTFFSDAGFEPFHPESWDLKLGQLVDLSTLDVTK